MAYKAIKVVTIGDKTFNPGDIIDVAVEDRLVRGKKVEIIEEDVKQTKEKKSKKEKEQKEELLIEDSSEVSVETQEAGE